MTQFEALKMVAASTFRKFNEYDWMGYAGCNAKEPMIAENGGYTIILDEGDDGDAIVDIYDPNGDGIVFVFKTASAHLTATQVDPAAA